MWLRLYASIVAFGLSLALMVVSVAPAEAARLTLQWDPVADERVTHYLLCRGRAPGKCDIHVNTGSRTTYTMCSLRAATTYWFTVRAASAAETSDPSNEVSSKPRSVTVPACSKPTL